MINQKEIRAVKRLMKKVAAGQTELSGFLGRGGDRFLGGVLVRKLENNFKKYFGVKHAVSFSSATTALQAAVAALGIGPGDQIITSPFTMSATPTSVLLNNAVPVFADVDPNTYCLSAESIKKKINKKTKAIIVVNLLGGSADYGPILKLAKEHNLKIIEDNAQAPGATYCGRLTGTIGDIGILSFNVHKVIQSGEGGMLITNNKRYAYRAQLVRNHGEVVVDDLWDRGDEWRELVVGSNYRLTEIQAAIMLEQLKKLDRFNKQRIALADYLTKRLKEFSWLAPVSVLPNSRHVYYLYPIKFLANRIKRSRKHFAQFLGKAGFSVNEGYQKPLYLLPIYQKKRIYENSQFPFVSKEFPQNVNYSSGICPTAERLYRRDLLVANLCQPPRSRRDIDSFLVVIKRYVSNE